LLVFSQYYYTNTMQNNLQHHYTEVAKHVGGMPIILYNVPPMAGGVAFTLSLIRELAEVPNIVGIKDTSGNIVQLTEIVQKVKVRSHTLTFTTLRPLCVRAVSAHGVHDHHGC
jgi:dihydrodipicolinate synthase/N-acetylneuraminate lyase